MKKLTITLFVLLLASCKMQADYGAYIKNLSGKPIEVKIDKAVQDTWQELAPDNTIFLKTTGYGQRGIYWKTKDGFKYNSQKYRWPESFIIKNDGQYTVQTKRIGLFLEKIGYKKGSPEEFELTEKIGLGIPTRPEPAEIDLDREDLMILWDIYNMRIREKLPQDSDEETKEQKIRKELGEKIKVLRKLYPDVNLRPYRFRKTGEKRRGRKKMKKKEEEETEGKE